MTQDEPTTSGELTRSVAEIEDELTRVEADFEALRARGPLHWLLHVFIIALFGVLGALLPWALVSMVFLLAGVPEWAFSLYWTPLLATAFAVTSTLMWPNIAIPKSGAQKPLQQLFEQRTALRSEHDAASARDAALARERAELQRDTHGGNLSIAVDSTGGGLEVASASRGDLAASAEEVALDLGPDEQAAEAERAVDAHHEV